MSSKNHFKKTSRILLLGSLGIFLLLPLSCCKEPPPPIPMYFEMDPTMKKFLYFAEGSWWVYKSNDGLYDTITVTSTYIENRRNVDKEGNLISTQEFFVFTNYSTYWKYDFRFTRSEVAPTVAYVHVVLTVPGKSTHLFRAPNEIGVRYESSWQSNSNFFTIQEKRDTTISGIERKLWIVNYNTWGSSYGNKPVRVTFVEGLGMTQKITEFENRTWDLVSHHLIPF